MLNIYLSPSNQPWNLYSYGNTNEKIEMEAVAKLVQKELQNYKDTNPILATLSLSPPRRDEEAKAKGAHLYLAIHSDAGSSTATGATGFYHPYAPQTKVLAQELVKQIQAVNPHRSNRSAPLRSGTAFGEINAPYQKGIAPVLIETDFHSNPTTARWIVENKATLAKAIAKAVAITYSLQLKGVVIGTPAPTPINGFLVKINTSVLNYRQGPGVTFKINGQVRGGEVYTIVEQRGDWGRLKSGAGWINLKYTIRK